MEHQFKEENHKQQKMVDIPILTLLKKTLPQTDTNLQIKEQINNKNKEEVLSNQQH